MESFRRKHKQILEWPSVLGVGDTFMRLALLKSLDYTNSDIEDKLAEIGYDFPAYCRRTYGTDCKLALLLPCASKLYGQKSKPTSGAFQEFLWRTMTREQWLEYLIRVNNFSKNDSKLAIRYLKKEIENHVPFDEKITFSSNFFNSFKNFKEFALRKSAVRLVEGLESSILFKVQSLLEHT